MTRAGAAAGGVLLAVLAAVSLNLPLQRDPLLLALPALALLVLALRDAGAGVVVTFALVPLLPVLGNLVRGPAVAPAQVALLSCGAAVLLTWSRGTRTAESATPLGVALAVSAAAGAVGGVAATLAALPVWAMPDALASLARNLWAVRPEEAAAPLRSAALHALPLAAYLLVRGLSPKRRALLLPLLTGSLALAAAWALVEGAGGPHLWPRGAYDAFARFGRSASTLGDHNAAAALFVLFLFPAAGYALARRGAARAAGAVAAALLSAGLLATGSRAAWLCAALAGAVVGVRALVSGRGRAVKAAAPALAAAAVLAVAALAAMFLPGTAGSVARERVESLAPAPAIGAMRSGRLPFWRTGLAMAAAHPLAGVGPGRVPAVFAAYRPADLPVSRENLHSWPLQCVAENGVVGGALLLLPFAALVPLLSRSARLLDGVRAGLVPGIAASAAAGLVSHPWLLPEVQTVFWTAAALLECALLEAAPGEVPAAARGVRAAAVGVLVAWGLPLLALSPGREAGRWGFGGWDFAEGQGEYEWIGPEAGLWIAPRAAGAGPVRIAVRRPEESPETEGIVVTARAGSGAWSRFAPRGTEWTEATLAPGPADAAGTLVELRSSRALCPASSGGGDRRILSVQLRRSSSP